MQDEKPNVLDEAQHLVLTLYFSDSAEQILPSGTDSTLGGVLYEINQHRRTQLTRGFDGCETFAGAFRGGFLGIGMEGQCRKVIKQVQDELARDGRKVILNVYGHGQGGFCALMLAEKLADFKSVEVNLALLDPATHYYLPGVNLANSKTLKRVLALYTDPYARGLPTCPNESEVEEIIIPPAPQFIPYRNREDFLSGHIPFLRISHFLNECGTRLSSEQANAEVPFFAGNLQPQGRFVFFFRAMKWMKEVTAAAIRSSIKLLVDLLEYVSGRQGRDDQGYEPVGPLEPSEAEQGMGQALILEFLGCNRAQLQVKSADYNDANWENAIEMQSPVDSPDQSVSNYQEAESRVYRASS